MRGDLGFPIRLRYSKRGKMRFASHRDLARSFDRAFRIAELPLAFTLGFSPRPKISLGYALGVGHESNAEYLDIELLSPVDIEPLSARIGEALPDGVSIDGVVSLIPRAPALQDAVTLVALELYLADMKPSLVEQVVQDANNRDEICVATTRKGRSITEDLRPGIKYMEFDGTNISLEVVTQPRGLRPADIARALREISNTPTGTGEDRVLRTHQWIERDGARLLPLEADRATPATNVAGDISKGISNDRGQISGRLARDADSSDTQQRSGTQQLV